MHQPVTRFGELGFLLAELSSRAAREAAAAKMDVIAGRGSFAELARKEGRAAAWAEACALHELMRADRPLPLSNGGAA